MAVLSLLLCVIWSCLDSVLTKAYFEHGRPEGASVMNFPPVEFFFISIFRYFGLSAYADAFSKTSQWAFLWRISSALSQVQWDHARSYYEEQRPHFHSAAAAFELHDYWDHMHGHVSLVTSWDWLLLQRTRGMRTHLEESGREDFKIEKDKCDMLEFFTRNEFPLPRVYGVWRSSATEFLEDLFHGRAEDANAEWPIFMKLCHLTQGSEDSVRRLTSRDWVLAERAELSKYIEFKWDHRAHDVDRIFSPDGDVLTKGLLPGVVLQEPFAKPVELKVQVLWGRAYLGYLLEGPGVVTRDGFFELGLRSRPYGVEAPTALSNVKEWAWIESEGHLPKVWGLAELAALAMGIDQVRIDVFIRRGEPDAVSINEISLTSGQPSHMHAEFMSRLWVEPLLERKYRLFSARTGANVSLPIHLQNCKASPCPNHEKVLADLAGRR